MTKKQILALFMALAALFGNSLAHSLVGAVTAAVLAALMFYVKVLPLDDSQPTEAQKNIGLAIAIVWLVDYILALMGFYWAGWWIMVFAAALNGYFGVILIMSLLSSWKKK
jgi:hypothetical protein